ncbi:MAG: phage holin family protein [Pseudomonadota bacterium]
MSATPSAGLFASVRQMLATALEMAEVRLALFASEFEEEKLRIFQALVLAVLGLLMLTVGAVLLCGFVLMLFWEGYRLAALGVMTAVFVAGGGLMVRSGIRRISGAGGAFRASLGELSRDRAGLAPHD